MRQIRDLLASLTNRQKLAVVVALVLTGVGLATFVRQQQEADYHPLFDKLSSEDAGQIVQKLKEAGVPYRLSESGTSVRVPSGSVAELRLEMASAGLPRTGRIGFELFDRTSFGTTDFGEQVNFRRALEGELERSIISLSEVESARVHISFLKNSVFLESREEAKASVLLQLRAGLSLTPQNVIAISHLVASAVEGLKPEQVSIVDGQGNLLSNKRRNLLTDGAEPSDATLEYRKKVETDFTQKISATLQPLLGAEKFRVGVSVECDFSSGEQSEETYDPDRSVMTTSARTEDLQQQQASVAGGVPGTSSSLPRPTGRSNSGPATTTRRTETIAYQTSRVTRHLKLPQGSIRKVSASVLLDQAVTWEKQGAGFQKVITPPSPEKLKSIRELVAATIGLNEERGDQLIVDSLPFETTVNLPPPVTKPAEPKPAPPAVATPVWKQPLVLYGGGAAGGLLVVGTVAFLVIRKRKRKARKGVDAGAAELSAAEIAKALAGPDHEKAVALGEARQTLALAPGGVDGPALEELRMKVREGVATNSEAYVKVLRGWLAEDSRV